ncbi:LVIVD repeat-containing protein [Corallococcus terminator]
MVKWTYGVVATLMCVGSLGACSSRDNEVVEVPVDLSPGAPIQDEADWVPEPVAACSLRPTVRTAEDCVSLDAFDLSGCDIQSLHGLDTSGVFNTRVLTAATATLPASSTMGSSYFEIDPAPGPASEGHPMYWSSSFPYPDGRLSVFAEVGCVARGPDRVTGCMLRCFGDDVPRVSTFEGVRVRRRQGETESSGGLTLLGEAAIGEGMGMPVDIYVAKGHAYVVSIDSNNGPGGLSVFDLKDRAAPRLVKSVQLEGDGYWNGVWAKDNALYVASSDRGVIVFDITDAANPTFVRDLSGGSRLNIHTVFVAGNRLHAMATRGSVGTAIYDVTNAREPVRLGGHVNDSLGPSAVSYPHDATSLNHLLFVSHWNAGLLILDATDPSNVKRLGAYTPPHATSHTSRVAYINNNLIAFEAGEGWGSHLRVLNLNDPANPTLIGEYKLSPEVSIHNMELVGGRLYLTHYQHGVRVLDVSRPARPRELAYFNTWRETDPHYSGSPYIGAIGIRVPGDGYVYVVDTERGLLIFPVL